MINEFNVVIFKNKRKKKVIKKYKSLERAIEFFDKMIENNNKILFEKKLENGLDCNHDLSVIGPYQSNSVFFIKDKLGRNIKIFSENNEFTIFKISEYKLEEKIYHINKNVKLSYDTFVKKFINIPGLKCISKLNNKIVHQIDDVINLFSCKSQEDCDRFFDLIEKYISENHKKDCLMVRDYDSNQKKYLYSILSEYGISKNSLYRHSTTHLK